MSLSMSIAAQEIVNQIGNKAMHMMGACNHVHDGDAIEFKIKGSRKISHIRIELNDNDLYVIVFSKWKPRALEMKEVNKLENVYNNDMHRLIEEETGLYLSL